MEVGSQRQAPAALTQKMTQYPLYRRLGRLQGQSRRVLKISRYALQNQSHEFIQPEWHNLSYKPNIKIRHSEKPQFHGRDWKPGRSEHVSGG
jgi:hypothetical protein